mmetsp:Transcript_16426/g.45019  ORF Transcript_16426/g.45019 Transcript_16426/m.45019 type:complete len:218 (-) Transcript_16426:2172-2825(-)
MLALRRLLGHVVHGDHMQDGALRHARDVGTMRHLGPCACCIQRANQQSISKSHTKRSEQVIQGWHICSTCHWRPPAARVVIEEAHLLDVLQVVPLAKNHKVEAMHLHILLNFGHLLCIILLFCIRYDQGAVLRGIEACERAAQHLHKVLLAPEEIKQLVVVGVQMVPMPVQHIMLDIQVVPRDVTRWVFDAMELIPQDTPEARGCGLYACLNGHHHR